MTNRRQRKGHRGERWFQRALEVVRTREAGALVLGGALGAFPPIVAPDEWLAARMRLPGTEKELTKTRDRLNTQRRELPMVRMNKDYVFEGPGGNVRLVDLFEGR